MGQCEFFTTCVNCEDVEALEEMIDRAKEISYRVFTSYVPEEELAEIFPGYDWDGGGGLTLEGDPYVEYYQSKYSGNFAVFVTHSAIEYVWICGMKHPRTLESQEIAEIKRRAGLG